jgi:hypothetical protein
MGATAWLAHLVVVALYLTILPLDRVPMVGVWRMRVSSPDEPRAPPVEGSRVVESRAQGALPDWTNPCQVRLVIGVRPGPATADREPGLLLLTPPPSKTPSVCY